MSDLMADLKGQFPPGFTVYRVQDCWRRRRGVVVRGPRRWWMRTWQAEWTGAPRAYRSFTRNGALVKAVRAAQAEAAKDFGSFLRAALTDDDRDG